MALPHPFVLPTCTRPDQPGESLVPHCLQSPWFCCEPRPYRELLFCSACLPGHRKLLVSSLCCLRVAAGCAILPQCIWAGLSQWTGSLLSIYYRVFTKCLCTNRLLVPCIGYIEAYGAEKQSLLLCLTSHVHRFWLGRPEDKMESLRPGRPEWREHQNSFCFLFTH